MRAVALLPECLVAHCEHLVDQDDRLIELGHHRERQPHLHAAEKCRNGVSRKSRDLGELDDLFELRVDARFAHAVQTGVS